MQKGKEPVSEVRSSVLKVWRENSMIVGDSDLGSDQRHLGKGSRRIMFNIYYLYSSLNLFSYIFVYLFVLFFFLGYRYTTWNGH